MRVPGTNPSSRKRVMCSSCPTGMSRITPPAPAARSERSCSADMTGFQDNYAQCRRYLIEIVSQLQSNLAFVSGGNPQPAGNDEVCHSLAGKNENISGSSQF